MAKILIVDDDAALCAMLSEITSRQGWQSVSVSSLVEAREMMTAANDFDVVLLDISLPDGSGLYALPYFIKSARKPEVIIITGEGGENAASLALNSGAWDYIEKPLNVKKIVLPIQRALEYRQARMAAGRGRIFKREGIVGSGPAMNGCLEHLAEAADGDHNILLYGETGTGKELFARTIHFNSHRREKNFVVVDCAALTTGLVESILFGHVKGAFTDAVRDRDGLIRLADGGTLFLDEVGELPLEMQKKFLGVLENRRFRPVGDTAEIESDFRLIAATNRNLEEMTEKGLFREDLFYRLKAQKLVIPPLRSRKEDIAELVNYYLARLCQRTGTQPRICQPEFMRCLYGYDWPGNVRELINLLDMVVSTVSKDQMLYHKDLPVEIRLAVMNQQIKGSQKFEKPAAEDQAAAVAEELATWHDFRKAGLQNLEQEYLGRLLEKTRGDLGQMTDIAGMGKSRIYELLEKHGLLSAKKH